MLVLSHTPPSTLTVTRYHQQQQRQQQQQESMPGVDGASALISWVMVASYQTSGSPLKGKVGKHTFGSEQMMASEDGAQVVLVVNPAGQCCCLPLVLSV